MKSIAVLFVLAASAMCWICPECGTENQGQFCSTCDLPMVPPGMEYVPSCTVSIGDTMTVALPAFFIDSEPVIARDILSWLSSEIGNVEQIHIYLTGQEELLMSGESMGEDYRNMVFIRYTPWVIYKDMSGQVTGVTVQTGSFDYPAVALTFDAARLFLNDNGKRLPTAAELAAATAAGIVEYEDTWEVMNSYSDFISMTLSGIIGSSFSSISMFAENRAPEERIMWEWTRDAWNQPLDSIADFDSPYGVIVKPLDPPVFGTALRESGYYNIIFRGVVPIPWRE